ncbi:hypothetical protein SAMN04488569_104418 [Marinilactibacillus piezotolerans]|uniref:Uncharacterized protein n=1 Tax=Marinilactibacillus piezotolerans TaxID=258723 RepID=A0A1I4A8D8_9LACT|nr:hypothetical protein SAMN04488569_104418 [Marinilactibacillus piezotolerans]
MIKFIGSFFILETEIQRKILEYMLLLIVERYNENDYKTKVEV